MKKIFYFLQIMLLSFIISGCDNQKTNETELETNNNEVSDVDKVRPSTTKLDYTDYSLFADGVKMPAFNEEKWYRNDLVDIPLPDPYVLEVDGVYYIYGTTDRTSAQSIDCYTTTDFNNFKLYVDVYKPMENSWEAKGGIFAPEMFVYKGEYYLSYSNVSKVNGMRYINVAKADNPLGPFKPIKQENAHGELIDGASEPIFRHNDLIGLDVLDQSMFLDDDGKMYMYYSVYQTGVMQYIVGFEMLDPITPVWDTYKILVRPGELNALTTNTNFLSWEAYTASFKVAEGPFMIKSPNGRYYLTYSVNHYPNRYYTVCYAEADSPLGDYTKPYTPEDKKANKTWTNLLFGYAGSMGGTKVFDQWGGFMSGTAHHCFFKIGDQWMIGYHAHRNREDSTKGRMFGMDYLFFDDNGVPYTEGPTYSIQPLPEAISGYKNIALTAQVKSSNVEYPERINDNYVVTHYNLVQEADKEVVLKNGKAYIELVFDKEYSIGGISIYNSAFYEKAVSEIEYINFFNDNVIYNLGFVMNYINDEKEFIFPGSSFTADFEDIKATRVVICFDTIEGACINEIKVFGK